MVTFEIFALLSLGLLAWLWLASLKAREIAVHAARQACADDRLQLLDDSVSLLRLRFERDGYGVLCLRREYAFDYSDTGNNRRSGRVILLGNRVEMIDVGLFLISSQ